MKLDTAGNLKWVSYFTIENSTGSVTIRKLLNQYIIAGQTNGLGQIRQNFILKIDINGKELFRKLFKSSESEFFNSLEIVNNNKYIICSEKDYISIPQLFRFSKVMIADSVGNVLREKLFYNEKNNRLYSMIPLSNRDIIFAGTSELSLGIPDDIWAVRTDSNLNSPIVTIINTNTLANSNQLFQNFPNPFNQSTKISFQIAVPGNVQIRIYNVLGEVGELILNKFLNSGKYELFFSPSFCPSGIYFYSFHLNDKLLNTKKMILKK